MLLLFKSLIMLVLLHTVAADVAISKPAASSTYTASGGKVSVAIAWVDDGTSPSLDSATSMTIVLCYGTASDVTALNTVATGLTATSKSYTASIDASLAGSGVYFFQLYTEFANGHTIHYSSRFKLSGMTGSVTPSGSLTDSLPSSEDTAGTTTTEAATTDLTAGMDVSKSFSVTYTLQTGKVRFAPMQMQPGSKVTATTWKRQFPTSAVTYYSSARKSPAVLSTITPGWSYTKTSYVNYATAQGTPSGWYSPSKKIQKPVLMTTATSSVNKRFWDLD